MVPAASSQFGASVQVARGGFVPLKSASANPAHPHRKQSGVAFMEREDMEAYERI